ncbi:hypothetical protein C4D60_Mb02t15250 [Musa balbisiana]|uniref:Secreted protein n=1 Tax=Musa balbisiana TaxID=52838 RepID=A0A4S8IAZ2_MUSBA|nr:hypothetical protein C4D60_Mb02t15250 [Musa balbisiana]
MTRSLILFLVGDRFGVTGLILVLGSSDGSPSGGSSDSMAVQFECLKISKQIGRPSSQSQTRIKKEQTQKRAITHMSN